MTRAWKIVLLTILALAVGLSGANRGLAADLDNRSIGDKFPPDANPRQGDDRDKRAAQNKKRDNYNVRRIDDRRDEDRREEDRRDWRAPRQRLPDNHRDDRHREGYGDPRNSPDHPRPSRDPRHSRTGQPAPLIGPNNFPASQVAPKPSKPHKPWSKPDHHPTIYGPGNKKWNKPKRPWYNWLFWMLSHQTRLSVNPLSDSISHSSLTVFTRTDGEWRLASKNLSLGLYNEFNRARYLKIATPDRGLQTVFKQVDHALTSQIKSNPNLTGLETEKLTYAFFQRYVDKNVDSISLANGQYAMKLKNHRGQTSDWINTMVKDSDISAIVQGLPPNFLPSDD